MPIRNLLILCSLFLTFPAFAGKPNFALPDVKGKIHQLSDYRGKWVVVNYWATWCPPCQEEIPELVDFYEQHHTKDAVVIGIDYEDSDLAYLQSFIEENMISYPILRANLTRAPVFGRLLGLPTTFIVSPDGELVQSKTGTVTKDFLEEVIQQNQKNNVVVTK